MDLKGKTAVITGANGAIGSALIQNLTNEGINCIQVDKEGEFGCDFTNLESVDKLSKKISLENKNIDFLFNIAGVGIYKKIDELEINEWVNTLSINVTSAYIFSKNLLSNLRQSKKSMIFNIGSGMGVIPAKDRSAYCTSKFALRGFSLSLGKEIKEDGIDVCLFTLGSVMTPFGTGGIDKRKELEREGKKYLTVDEVIEKIVAITKSETREEEYVMYPDGYL